MAQRAGSTNKGMAPSPPPGHNNGPLSRDDMDDLWLVHLAQARTDNDALDRAMEGVRAVRKVRGRNRTVCRMDGFPLAQLDEILVDEGMLPSLVREREDSRARMRGLAGQPGGSVGEQQDMFVARDRNEAEWREWAYGMGLRGAEIAWKDVPGEMVQAVEGGFSDGQMRLARAWDTKQRIESAAGGAAAAPEEPAAPPAAGRRGRGNKAAPPAEEPAPEAAAEAPETPETPEGAEEPEVEPA